MKEKEIRIKHNRHNTTAIFKGIQEPKDIETLEKRDLGGKEADYEGGVYNIVSDPDFHIMGGGGGENSCFLDFEGSVTVQELREIQERFERFDPRHKEKREEEK